MVERIKESPTPKLTSETDAHQKRPRGQLDTDITSNAPPLHLQSKSDKENDSRSSSSRQVNSTDEQQYQSGKHISRQGLESPLDDVKTTLDDVLNQFNGLNSRLEAQQAAIDEIQSQQTEMRREMSQEFTLFTDRFTSMQANLASLRGTGVPRVSAYAPQPLPRGPDGKQTWYFAR